VWRKSVCVVLPVTAQTVTILSSFLCVHGRQSIFLLISVISVVTNAGLTVFTMNTLNQFTDATRYWIFVLFQWVCFILQVSGVCCEAEN
jgi:hypothetical protein